MADVRVPWHRSLLVRVFAAGAVIALVAVAAATWATVRATTVAVREAQQDSLHTDARVYDELVGYAATHRDWSRAGDLVRRLARDADRRVSVTDEAGRVLVDSQEVDGVRRDPARARAVLDALAVDPVLLAGTEDESPLATYPSPCTGDPCKVRVVTPQGRADSRVGPRPPDAGQAAPAEELAVDPVSRAWRRTLRDLDACLVRAGVGRARSVSADFAVVMGTGRRHGAVVDCVEEARRAWYAGHVAPPALLFVEGEEGSAEVFWDLSRANQVRIALLAGGVLLVTLLLCLLLASSLARPLRRMAAAAHRAADGDLDVRVAQRRRDEVGAVAAAFDRMAERRQQLEEARRRLVSDVSHELRTPLANVRGWLEAAQDGIAEPDERLLASLHEETLHLQRLVDDLHDLALGDAGELRLDPVEIEVPVFLEQVVDAFRGAAGGVDLVVSAVPGSTVRADPVRIRQAVGNLVANALRHTPDGGVVTLRGADGVLEVADTGEGIPPEDLPYVFDRFRRADSSRSRTTGGSGLGLAIVRHIVEAHGGTATVTSDVGAGTVVRLTLP